MVDRNEALFEIGKHLIKALMILQFKQEEILEVLETLGNDENILQLVKWIQHERTTIIKLLETDTLDDIKGLVFAKASEIANGNNIGNFIA